MNQKRNQIEVTCLKLRNGNSFVMSKSAVQFRQLAPYLLNVIESASNDFHKLPAELPAFLLMPDILMPDAHHCFFFSYISHNQKIHN